MSTENPIAFALWAKTGPVDAPETFHPLICHMLDVAAVARVMWTESLSHRQREELTRRLGWDNHADALVSWLAGAHDIGKAEPTFQAKANSHLARLTALGFVFPRRASQNIRHGTVSAITLGPIVDGGEALARSTSPAAAIIGGHHGTPIDRVALMHIDELPDEDASWKGHRGVLAAVLAKALGATAHLPHSDTAALIHLGGLISVADWIGSDASRFPPYCVSGDEWRGLDADDYLRRADQAAHTALRHAGWLPPPRITRPRRFTELFPGRTPRPAQALIETAVAELDEPALLVVECETGSGKTESALSIAEHAMARLGARGFYIALPTQATSNQMFGRTAHHLASRWPDDASELHLLHGNAALSADYSALRPRDPRHESIAPTGIHSDGEDGPSGGAVAHEWFMARKRGLLSPFAVGTVDQALLGILNTRHFFVRLFGLSSTTVILDEVHAYDTYTGALIERLVHWLAALDSTVVVLSATLPTERLRMLEASYRAGREVAVSAETDATDAPDDAGTDDPVPSYPRLSIATHRCVQRSALPRSAKPRLVELQYEPARWAETPPALVAAAARMLEPEGCIGVVCNTVAIAQSAYREALAVLPNAQVVLLHARMRFMERDAIERDLLTALGPGDDSRPSRLLVIATQVIEQSLDIDFDGLVTQLAPVDLVIQRIGRLHRHRRQDRPRHLAEPRVVVCGPTQDADGVPTLEDPVYDRNVLLRSHLALRDRSSFTAPDDVDDLVQNVYRYLVPGEGDGGAALVEALSATASASERDRHEALYRAEGARLPEADGSLWHLGSQLPDDEGAFPAVTRLGGPSVSVVVLTEEERQRMPPLSSRRRQDWRWFIERSINVSSPGLVTALMKEPDTAPAQWRNTPLLRRHRLIVLDAEGNARVDDVDIHHDAHIGLEWKR